MGYSDFKYYKPTFWDKFTIEGCSYVFLILFVGGIWIQEFRWRLIFTSIFIFIIGLMTVLSIEKQDRDLKEANE